MATATYLEQSFLVPFWQHVIDVNAELIPVPMGAVSGSLGGFDFENIGGTYTVVFGADIVLGESAPLSGTVTLIARRSTLDPFGTIHTGITGSYPATGIYEAFRGGGTELFASVFSGNDTVDILS